MSRADRRPDEWAAGSEERQERVLPAMLLAALAGTVALWPYTSVIQPGRWTLVAMSAIVVVALSGLVLRRTLVRRGRTARELLTLLGQIAIAIALLTLTVAPQRALLGVIPTPATLQDFGALGAQAFDEIAFGTAPLQDTAGLRAVIGIGFAAIAILLDHLVAQRLALFAGLLTAVAGAVPMIVTFGEANVVWFVLLAVVVLLLLRHAVRQDRSAPPRSSAALAVGVGAGAVVLALIVAPALPVSASWVGLNASVNLNPTLRLGEDLRRPTASEVLTLATSADTAPYLRIATLSRFDGRVWHPDDTDVQDLADGFGDPEWSEQIATSDQRTSIRVLGVSSSWLPVPYPATRVQGVSSGWDVMPLNRTVVSETVDAAGEDYTVTSAVVVPSLEQIQAAAADGTATDDASPETLPPAIAATALAVTAGIESDYDKLIALQNWFRSEFEYSLETPVEEDFDGTGADAVARFLEVRSGYCIHFAGAFALMAQTLEMPVRIVVGYLPGSRTDQRRGEEVVYSVSSDQLHAWPEVRFEGIGWVPFEPTASLGVPTAFLPSAGGGGTSAGPSAPAPTTAPTEAPTGGPDRSLEESEDPTAGGGELRRLDSTPVLLFTAGSVLVLLLPALIRFAVRMLRLRRARRGDAATAWAEVHETLVDLRLPVSDADTPRLRARHLRDRGADEDAIALLVSAIERRSYSRAAEPEVDLSTAVAHVVTALNRSVDGRARAAAMLMPRSLFAPRAIRRSRPA